MSGKNYVTRRDFVRLSGLAAAATLAAACQPKVVEVEKVVKETVMVAGTPQVVEKVVKETVQVEKVVQQTVVVEKAAPEAITLEWWFGWGGGDLLDAIAFRFQQEHPDIRVNPLAPGSMDEKLLTSIGGGTPPDVAVGNIAFGEMCARNVFTELDDFFAASTVVQHDDIVESLWADGNWDGKQYGLAACEVGPRYGTCYNPALVEAAGLDPDSPPDTWEEMYVWHEAMTTFDDVGNIEILGVDPLDSMGGRRPTSDVAFYWSTAYGGYDWWDQDNWTFDLDNEGFIASLATVKKFYDLVGVEQMAAFRVDYGTWTSSTGSFVNSVQGVQLNGYWTPGSLAHAAPDTKFRYWWPPNYAQRKGVKWQNMGGHPAVLPKGIAHPAESFSFLEFLTTPTAADKIFAELGWFGPRISWLEQVDTSIYDGLDFFSKSVLEADELVPCPLCPISGFFGQQWIIARDAVNYGDKTPEEAAADLQEIVTAEIRTQFPDRAG